MNKTMLIGILLCTLSTVTSNKSNASLLVSGDSIDLSGTTAMLQPELVGSIIHDETLFDSVSPSGNEFFVGGIQVQNRVVRSNLHGTWRCSRDACGLLHGLAVQFRQNNRLSLLRRERL